MALEVGDLIAKLRLDAGQFTTGLKQAGVDMERFGGKLLVMGKAAAVAFVAHKVVEWTKEVARATEATEHLSLQTGIAAQRFEEMSVSLGRVGLSGQDLGLGFRQLSRNLVAARDDASEAAEAFRTLGVEPGQLRDSEQALRAIADQFAKMPDGINKAALAQELFGRAGQRLIPILNQGSAGMDALTQKSREFGLVLSEIQRTGLTTFDDALDDLGKSMEGFKTQVAAFIAPAATTGVEGLTTATSFATFMFQELSAASVALTARLANLGTFLVEAAKTGVQVGESAEKTRGQLAALWQQLTKETEAVIAATEADKEKARVGDIVAEVEKKIADAVRGRTAAERAQMAKGLGIVEDTQKALLVMEQLGTSFEVAESMVRGKTTAQLEGIVAVGRAEQALGATIIQIEERKRKERDETFGLELEAMEALRLTQEEFRPIPTFMTQMIKDAESLQRLLPELTLGQAFELAAKNADAAHQSLLQVQEDLKHIAAEGKAQEALGRHIVEQTTTAWKEAQMLASNMFAPFEQAMDRAVQGVILGTNTMRQAFKQLGQSIILEFAQAVIKKGLEPLKNALAESLFGAFGGGQAGAGAVSKTAVQSLATLAVGAFAAAGALLFFAETLKQSGKGAEKWGTGLGLLAGAIIGGIVGGPVGAGVGALGGALIGGAGGGLIGRGLGGDVQSQNRTIGTIIGAAIGTAFFAPIGGMLWGPILGNVIGNLFGGGAGGGDTRNQFDWLNGAVAGLRTELEAASTAVTPKALMEQLSSVVLQGRERFAPTVGGVAIADLGATEAAKALLGGAKFDPGDFRLWTEMGERLNRIPGEFAAATLEMQKAMTELVTAMLQHFRQLNADALSLLADMQLDVAQLRGKITAETIAMFSATAQQAIDLAHVTLIELTDPQQIIQQTQTIRGLIQQRYQGEIQLLQAMSAKARESQQVAHEAAMAWDELGQTVESQLADLRGMQADIGGGPLGTLTLAQGRFQDVLAQFRAAPTAALGAQVQGLAGPLMQAAQGMFARPSPEFQAILSGIIADLEEVQAIAAAQELAQLAEEERWRVVVEDYDRRIAEATEAMAMALQNLAEEMAAMLREMGFILPTLGIAPGPAPIPFQHGTVSVPSTGLALLHRGEMVIPSDQAEMIRAGGGGTTLVIERLTVEGASDPEATGRAVVKAIERSLRTGRLGMAVVERTRRG